MSQFEGEELSKGNVSTPVTVEEDESENREEVGEDEVGSQVEG